MQKMGARQLGKGPRETWRWSALENLETAGDEEMPSKLGNGKTSVAFIQGCMLRYQWYQ